MTPNLSRDERIVTLVASVGVLALAAYLRPVRTPLAVTSAALFARATTGFCPMTAVRDKRTQRELSGASGTHLDSAITIAASPEAVYRFWRDPQRLAQALPSHVTVHADNDRQWHWSLGSIDTPDLASWTSEIIHDDDGRVLSWQTTDDSVIVSAGSVSFTGAASGRATEVRVRMQYSPPLGRVGAAIATLVGYGAEGILQQSLSDIKRVIEMRQPKEISA